MAQGLDSVHSHFIWSVELRSFCGILAEGSFCSISTMGVVEAGFLHGRELHLHSDHAGSGGSIASVSSDYCSNTGWDRTELSSVFG